MQRTWAGWHEQGMNIKRVNQPYVTEWVMNTNMPNGPMNGWSARITNVYRTQRTSNERITNKLRTCTGQYKHTSDNYWTKHVYPAHSISLRFKFSSKFAGFSKLSDELNKYRPSWTLLANDSGTYKKNIKPTLTNNNEYNPFLVRMVNPAKCVTGY